MFGFIGSILSIIFSLIFKVFKKSPEQKIEERHEKQASDLIDRINNDSDGFNVVSKPKQWDLQHN